MRKTWFALLCALLLGSPVMAEKIDCQSMAEVGAALDQIREGLSDGEEVDDETDEALAGVVLILHAIAEEEGNAKLDRAVDRLEQAWTDNDRPGFIRALQEVDTLFGALYVADCD